MVDTSLLLLINSHNLMVIDGASFMLGVTFSLLMAWLFEKRER